jgi:surfeit locus 1 family protein
MMLPGFKFRASLVPTLAAVATIALTISLGRWQLSRAAEKEALQVQYEHRAAQPALRLTGTEVDPETLHYRSVAAEGIYVPEQQILLDNKFFKDQVGYQVVTPLRLGSGNRCILVNRGWVARGADYAVLPRIQTPAGRVRVEGTAVPPSKKFVELSPATVSGSVWQNLVLSRYRERTGLDVMEVVLQQRNEAGDALLRSWERPDTGIEKHRGYAFQWFALAAAVFITYVALNFKRA